VDQTQHEFSAEIEERVEQLFAAIDALRKSRADSLERRELLDRVFRHTHTIKGAAAAIGLKRLSEIAHEFENLLASVRSGQADFDESVLDSFEETAQLLFDQLTLNERHPVNAMLEVKRPVTPDVQRMHAENALNALPLELSKSLTHEEKENLVAALEEGSQLFVVTASFDIDGFEQQVRRLQDGLKSQGQIISSLPIVDSDHPHKINFRIVYVSQVELAQLRSEFGSVPDVSLYPLAPQQSTSSPATRVLEPFSNLIPVKLKDLDQLAATAHRLFVRTMKALETACASVPSGEVPTELEKSLVSIREQFMALESEIIGLRMVPVGRTLQRAVRAGRTAARASNKNIDFEVAGADIRMDKLLVNAISDPLIHLVRNSVDHGIESVEERVRLGKSKRGLIRIEVTDDGGQSVATVSDDGRGVNPAVISRAAVRLGIIAKDATVDLERSLRLIFRPGFSSAPSVSGTSGRGVGLDVVETVVEQAGGEIRVSSEVNKGTVFEIRMPVSFALLNSTIVKSEDDRYCLDTSLINRSEVIEARQLEAEDENLVLKIESETLPVFYLRTLLGQPVTQSDSDDLLSLVFCEFRRQRADAKKTSPQRVGLIVDRIEGTEEVLVRSLGSHAGRWRGVAGATELRSGKVALVLDLPRLIQSHFHFATFSF
jgi:two-component system chemotaxis sensor kinase CheA